MELYNKVLTDTDRQDLQPTVEEMRNLWPEMFSRKIADSLVQFAFAFKAATSLDEFTAGSYVLSAGSHEDIVTECMKLYGYAVVGIDPVINCDLHTFAQRYHHRPFNMVISASVLEHTTNDEEFIADACSLLSPEGYGIFTMDFKDDWKANQPVPYTSNRFYTSRDLTDRLPAVLAEHGCRVVGKQDYSARDRFVWDGINYSFATFVFKKG